jgi:hypothetical protein
LTSGVYVSVTMPMRRIASGWSARTMALIGQQYGQRSRLDLDEETTTGLLPRHYFPPARQSAPDREGAGRSAASPPRTPTWVGSRKVALITGGNLGRTVRSVRGDVSNFGDLDQLSDQIKREPGSLQ